MALPKRKRELTDDDPQNPVEEILTDDNAARALRNLNFKVPPDFRKRFKSRANAEDIPGVELLRRALAAYEREQGIA